VSIAVMVRPALAGDEPFLWEMLFEAATVSDEVRAMGKVAALAMPAIARYLDDWGRSGDAAVVAVDADGRRLGAAWYRVFPDDAPGYGFVAPDLPELAIGVAPAMRGRGIGHELRAALIDVAREQGFAGLSLAVDRRNRARRLYERLGFRDAGISPSAGVGLTMVVPLESSPLPPSSFPPRR